jgi:phage-related protein
MALMQALLKIKADVEGSGAVQALGRAIGGLSSTAGKVSGGLRGLAGAAGGLSGALGSLVPLATGAGLAAMAKGAIDAADNMNDLSQKTGVSVESLSKFQQAANASGTSIEGVGAAMIKLNRNLVNTADAADEYARSTEQAMEDAVDAAKKGEQRQTAAVQAAADKRLEALEQESDERLKEINKRYRNEQKILDDGFDDQEQIANEAESARQRQQERALEQQFDIRKKAIQNDASLSDSQRDSLLASLRIQEEDASNLLDSGYEKQRKARSRQFRDAKQQQEDALEERKDLEIKQTTSRLEAEKTLTKDYAVQQVALIRETTEKQVDSLKELSEGPKGAAEALRLLGLSATDASGKLKSSDQVMLEVADKFAKMPDDANKTALAMALFGKAGADMIPLLNGGRKSIEDLTATMTTKFAKAADELNDKTDTLLAQFLRLGVSLGTALMPALNLASDLAIKLANAFAAMPAPFQAIVGGVVALAAAFVVLAPAISAVISIAGVLAGLKIGATIAGWAALAGPAITAISAAFSGLLAFLTGTLLPGLLAFFSGPVGWTVLAVAAVVAMVIAFRQPLGDFLNWLWNWGEPIRQFWAGLWKGLVDVVSYSMKAVGGVLLSGSKLWLSGIKTIWTAIGKGFTTLVVDPISKAWTALNQLLPDAMKKTGDMVSSVWTGIINSVKNVFRSMLNFIVSGINRAVSAINYLIDGYNRIPPLPDIQRLGFLSVPAFAEGGVVDRPTLAMVGDGNEREFIIPQSKMAAASANFLSGARGGAVIPQASGGGGGSTGKAQISITTGPVLQQGGEQYVTLYDLERAMQMTADGVYRSLRTSSGRYATGVR